MYVYIYISENTYSIFIE